MTAKPLKDASTHGYGLNLDELPTTAIAARAGGSRFFYNGQPCGAGHVGPRYSKTSNCVACQRVVNIKRVGGDESRAGVRAAKHKARVDANSRGETEYTPVEPCPAGHYKRWVSSNNCIQCDVESRARHKLSAKFSRIKKEYGLTREDYLGMVERQAGACAICGTKPESHFSLHIDHCHTTGSVRGLLCGKCNQAIGLFNEDKSLMGKAMEYLSCN